MHTVIRLKRVMEKTGLARSTIYKRVAQNEFPKQISLGGNAVGWLKSDIDSWIEQQIAKSANDNNVIKYIIAANDNCVMVDKYRK